MSVEKAEKACYHIDTAKQTTKQIKINTKNKRKARAASHKDRRKQNEDSSTDIRSNICSDSNARSSDP